MNSQVRAIEKNILKAKVLIVDDDPDYVKLIKKALELAGYENIRCAYDSKKVCDFYQEWWPDVLLLDLFMPNTDGFQILQKLQSLERRSYLPILVLTAETGKESLLRTLDAGAKDFLTKPFDTNEIQFRIRNILEVRLLHNELRNQNVILDQKVLERTKELEETRLSVIRRLGHAAEWRDNETGNHVIRMSKSSEILGLKMGMNAKHAELVLNASPMHDIGKIGIPDAILLKPGPLDKDEWETMKTHVSIGAEILSGDDSELMLMAKKIALEHHEKWDGTGYPNGLSGEDISLEGRVVMICDVFDALTSKRSYKKAWSVSDALKYTEENKGSHFDPRVVDNFKKVLPEIIKIKNNFTD